MNHRKLGWNISETDRNGLVVPSHPESTQIFIIFANFLIIFVYHFFYNFYNIKYFKNLRFAETETDIPRPMWNGSGRNHNHNRDFESWMRLKDSIQQIIILYYFRL